MDGLSLAIPNLSHVQTFSVQQNVAYDTKWNQNQRNAARIMSTSRSFIKWATSAILNKSLFFTLTAFWNIPAVERNFEHKGGCSEPVPGIGHEATCFKLIRYVLFFRWHISVQRPKVQIASAWHATLSDLIGCTCLDDSDARLDTLICALVVRKVTRLLRSTQDSEPSGRTLASLPCAVLLVWAWKKSSWRYCALTSWWAELALLGLLRICGTKLPVHVFLWTKSRDRVLYIYIYIYAEFVITPRYLYTDRKIFRCHSTDIYEIKRDLQDTS